MSTEFPSMGEAEIRGAFDVMRDPEASDVLRLRAMCDVGAEFVIAQQRQARAAEELAGAADKIAGHLANIADLMLEARNGNR